MDLLTIWSLTDFSSVCLFCLAMNQHGSSPGEPGPGNASGPHEATLSGAAQKSWLCSDPQLCRRGQHYGTPHTTSFPTPLLGQGAAGSRGEPTCRRVVGGMGKRSQSDGHWEQVAMHAVLGVCLAGCKRTRKGLILCKIIVIPYAIIWTAMPCSGKHA